MFPPPSSRDLTPQQKVTQEWDAMAGEWDDLAAGYAAGFEKLLWSKIDVEQAKDWSVLDFGCGTGLLTDRLRAKVSNIVAMDVSSQMVGMLEEKILSQEWSNTRSLHCVLGELDAAKPETKQAVEALFGTMDLIVASSVLTFIPEDDVAKTMDVLGKFLKPGGKLLHSDWTRSEAKHPNGMDEAKALSMYSMAGLDPVSTEIPSLDAGGDTLDVFFGVAEKSLQ